MCQWCSVPRIISDVSIDISMHTFDLDRVDWGALASGTRVLSSDLDDDDDMTSDDGDSFGGDDDESDDGEW